ncbi:MAG: heme biosynthesis HemY N-terminal domain-containing protein [Pseudomonadota bacterium]
MLWSVIKICVFVGLVAAASYGAIFLLNLDGGMRIQVAGHEYNFSPIQAVIALVLLVLAVWILLKLAGLLVAVLRFINGDETAISRYFQKNRQEKGYQALSEGLLALASGEGEVAMAKANKANSYLKKPALTNLITAQGAELSGNRHKAEEVYKRLLTNEKTRFVGVRGIMRQKLADGDTDTALKLAQTAFAIKPKNVEVQDTLLKLQAEKHDWSGARKTLSTKLKTGALPRDVHKRRDAVLAVSEAKDALLDGNSAEAREASIEANRLSPDLVPAAVLAARSYIEQGSKRNASRVVTKAWSTQPHPDLAAVFAEIEPDETPEARLKRFNAVFKLKPDHPETKMLRAELEIAAENFPAARRAMDNLAETNPTKRSLTLMAAIERGEGADDSVVNAWLAKALTASPGPQWISDLDGRAYPEWQPMTNGALDTLSWKTSPDSEVMPESAVGMLPLIVGTAKDNHADSPAPKDTAVPADDEISDAEVVSEPVSEAAQKPG